MVGRWSDENRALGGDRGSGGDGSLNGRQILQTPSRRGRTEPGWHPCQTTRIVGSGRLGQWL